MQIKQLAGGANQHGLRNYNERLILSLIQRHGALPGSEIARQAGLSPQTVSVILRQLERDGLLQRGHPVRGKVGKPSVPMSLAPEGVFSLGLKIGRRSADLVLVDFLGTQLTGRQTTFRYPTPERVFGFLDDALRSILGEMAPIQRARLAGIGIAAPFQLWNWYETIGAPKHEMDAWRDVDFAERTAAFSDLPVFVENDATAACRAEHVYGRGKSYQDFAYFYLGSFIGGGLVLNHTVFDGRRGNAGAFGSLPIAGPDGPQQLIDTGSLYLLEADLTAAGLDPSLLWAKPLDWSGFPLLVEGWLDKVAVHLAQAALSVCAVIDFEAVLIDGALPKAVRQALVSRVNAAMPKLDARGLIPPEIAEGSVGPNARPLGAALAPIFSQLLLDTHTGFGAG